MIFAALSIDSDSSLVQRGRVDTLLLTTVLALMSFGLVMVLSASIDVAADSHQDPWFFAKRHGIYLVLALVMGMVIFSLPTEIWNRFGIAFLFIGLALLIAVLIPGIGKVFNGSRRWLSIGPITVQASEAAKFCFIVFFASYLARRSAEFRQGWSALFKLSAILVAFVYLLLLEPDFGSSVVLCITAGAMMFMAGIPFFRFLILAALGIAGMVVLAVESSYRWERLNSFLDPWADQFFTGYQLVQSLIAFGRGQWFGLGLGNSLQKLFFLPEAHTDFIFSIIAEEFGLIGALALLACFTVVIWRILALAFLAYKNANFFASYCCVGVAVLFSSQVFINMGVASGLLPTKGLTLPFVSSGGSSLLVCTALAALILRLGWELNDDRT
jgi:cell division protein FtsW